jgi:hypothetical protein
MLKNTMNHYSLPVSAKPDALYGLAVAPGRSNILRDICSDLRDSLFSRIVSPSVSGSQTFSTRNELPLWLTRGGYRATIRRVVVS